MSEDLTCSRLKVFNREISLSLIIIEEFIALRENYKKIIKKSEQFETYVVSNDL